MSTTNEPNELEVKNNLDAERFEASLENSMAFVQYRVLNSKRIVFIHTEVPPEFAGRGIGNHLAQVALEYAKAQGYEVEARCPFIAAYIRKHAEYQPITLGY